MPSPLLGPATWGPVAAWCRDAGHPARVVEYPGHITTPADVTAAAVAAGRKLADPVLVPHSNAGFFAPHLGEQLAASATVFVDAALPTGGPNTALAPESFHEFLGGLVEGDGLLPPWTEWWPDAMGLFPDADARASVEAEQRRLPLSYFESGLSVPAGWQAGPHGYLAFGETYADEVAFAREHGWPVRRMPGGHLHMLHDPAGVGTTILELLSAAMTP